MENIHCRFEGTVTIGCPVRFQDQPKKHWVVDQAFIVEKSDGTEDSLRILWILGFRARLPCPKAGSALEPRLVVIRCDSLLQVNYVDDTSVTFVFADLSEAGIKRSVTFIKNCSEEVNLIHAA